uniref:NRF domain-containing protein n=1 Tax=Rhabditophanes sp. KR3021 TaxID=114890 RepID=A0AC35TY30_9BILA
MQLTLLYQVLPIILFLTSTVGDRIVINEENDLDYLEDALIDGSIINNFFHDSKSKLILELDFFQDAISIIMNATESAKDGDTNPLYQLIELLEPIKNFDISAACVSDLYHFIDTTTRYAKTVEASKKCLDCGCKANISIDFDSYEWIFDVVDAMGKVPSAVMGGNNLWIGSWHTCNKINVQKNVQNQRWKGQYCKLEFQTYNKNNPLVQMATNSKTDPSAHCTAKPSPLLSDNWSEEDSKCFTLLPLINFGVCTPDTCTEYDVERIINYIYRKAEALSGKKLVCDAKVHCQSERAETKLANDPNSMLVIYFLTAILGIVIFGTLYDIYVYQPLMKKNRPVEKNWFIHLILAFSLFSNGKSILENSKGRDQITCLHGTRVLSMFWIILGHTYWYICTSLTADNVLQTLRNFPKYFHNQIIVQAPLAVDSFFLLSSMLTTYLFFKKALSTKKDATGKVIPNPHNLKSGTFWVVFYLRRYIRLTPVYVVVMILDVTVLNYISSGPFWQPVEKNYCRLSWWTNLIYMNNFLLQDVEQCMGWSWYLANDFQLYLFCPLYILLLHYNEKWGIAACLGTLGCSSIFRLIISLVKGYPPAPILTTKLEIVSVLNDYWNDLYVKPYIRCGPYMIGILVGYFLYKAKAKFDERMVGSTLNDEEKSRLPIVEIPPKKLYLIWGTNTICGLYSVFGLYNYSLTGDIGMFHRVFYTLLGRPFFSISLGWVVYACATGNGGIVNRILSWKAFVPLSKITFCAYLMHPLVLQFYNFSRPQPFHFTSTYQMFTLYSVAVAASFFVAFFVACFFEFPVTYIDKLIFEGSRNKKPMVEETKLSVSYTPTPISLQNGNQENVPLTVIDEEREEEI